MCFRGKGKANKFQRILILFTIFEQAFLTCHWTFNRRKAFVSVNLWCVSILITNQRNACAPVKFKIEPPHNYSSTHAVTHKNIIIRSTKQGWVCFVFHGKQLKELFRNINKYCRTELLQCAGLDTSWWVRSVTKLKKWGHKNPSMIHENEWLSVVSSLEEFLLHCWYSKCTYVCTVTHYLYDLT